MVAVGNPPVTTKTGDSGFTDLLDEKEVPKYSLRVEVNGTLDEAQAFLGLVRARSQDARIRDAVFQLQSQLYLLMADIAGSRTLRISDASVAEVECLSEEIKNESRIPRGFITPGATEVGALLDITRTILRRAERRAALLLHTDQIPPASFRYLNRAGDYLFVLARWQESFEGEQPDRPFNRNMPGEGVQ